MAILVIGKIKQKNNGTFALMDAADVELPDGTRLDKYLETLDLESGHYIPGIEMSADGTTMTLTFTPSKENLPAVAPKVIPLPVGPRGPQGAQGAQGIQGEPGATGAAGADGGYYTPDVVDNQNGEFTFTFTPSKEGMPKVGAIAVRFPESSASGLPEVTAEDNDKILQVVEGVWTKVALADSAVKTYVDDYINEALGGEY